MYQSCHIFLALLVELAGVCVFQKFTILICFLKMQKQGHETHSPLLRVHTTSTPKKKHPTQWCCSHNFLQAGVGTFSDLVACTRQTHLKIQANTHQSQFWNHLQDLELILTDSENHSPPPKKPTKTALVCIGHCGKFLFNTFSSASLAVVVVLHLFHTLWILGIFPQSQ